MIPGESTRRVRELRSCRDGVCSSQAKGSKGAWDEWMGIQLECQYEEDLTKQPEARVRWYEAAGTYGGVLASRPNSKKRPL